VNRVHPVTQLPINAMICRDAGILTQNATQRCPQIRDHKGDALDSLRLLVDLHIDADRQGPGGDTEFLEVLEARGKQAGFAERITTRTASMDSFPFAAGSLDAIWSESAIYNMGLGKGVQLWRRFLNPDGILAVSELTRLTVDQATLESGRLRQSP